MADHFWVVFGHKFCLLTSSKDLPVVRLIYMAFKADLKARKQCHLLEENYLSRRMCDRCQAVQLFTMAHDPLSYKNLQENAPYTRTCKGHDEYIQGARQISPWAVVPGWQFESLTFDMMHIIFLGIAKNHIPSCLKMLKLAGYHYEVNESDEQFLKKVSFNMRQDCKDHKPLALSSMPQNWTLLTFDHIYIYIYSATRPQRSSSWLVHFHFC